MPHISICLPSYASTKAVAVYEEFYTQMRFPSAPNFIMTQGHSSTVARGTWELVRHVLVLGDLPRWTKEMIFVAISYDRNCGYCTAAHIACCRMLMVDPEWIQMAAGNADAIPDPLVRDVISFARKSARDPQSLTTEDYAVLRAHGLTDAKILEVISMSALAVYANIMADATRMDADAIFSAGAKESTPASAAVSS